MLTVVCENNIIIWLFLTASKWSPVLFISFFLKTLKNKQHPCKRVRVDDNGALENSTDITNLLVDKFNISMETTGDDASCLNEKN